ncbi:hypothetical protein GJ496_003304 [Pomphorhynchus laevis]|nr:hypothetical protein GJ496_003304 [Pomphorhynchus laevis]
MLKISSTWMLINKHQFRNFFCHVVEGAFLQIHDANSVSVANFTLPFRKVLSIILIDAYELSEDDCDHNIVVCEFTETLIKGPLSNTISHYWNMVWRDNVRSIIILNNILRSQHVFEHSPVIHCSAGIGRSGTFAFVDIVLTLLAASEGCNSHAQLMNILHNLRNERPGLIQTPEQLRFVFLSIIRAFCDVNMKINPKWVSEFIDFMEEDSSMNLKSARGVFEQNTIASNVK